MSDRLRDRREALGLSTREAEARTGVGYAKINRIEREYLGDGSGGGVSAPTLVKFAQAYGVSTDWLCGLTDEPAPASHLMLRPTKKKAAKKKAARKVAKKA